MITNIVEDHCRLCLSHENTINIFNKELTNSEKLQKYIFMCSGVNILISDIITKYVCYNCFETIKTNMKFRKNAITNDISLKKTFNQQHNNNENNLNSINKQNVDIHFENVFDFLPLNTYSNEVKLEQEDITFNTGEENLIIKEETNVMMGDISKNDILIKFEIDTDFQNVFDYSPLNNYSNGVNLKQESIKFNTGEVEDLIIKEEIDVTMGDISKNEFLQKLDVDINFKNVSEFSPLNSYPNGVNLKQEDTKLNTGEVENVIIKEETNVTMGDISECTEIRKEDIKRENIFENDEKFLMLNEEISKENCEKNQLRDENEINLDKFKLKNVITKEAVIILEDCLLNENELKVQTLNKSEVMEKEKNTKTKNEKSYLKCLKCEKTFSSRKTWLAHKSTHSNVKRFECSDCGKEFRRKSHLQEHLNTLIHKKEKKNKSKNRNKGHKCSDCGKIFPHLSKLITHQRIHTGVKPFECSICANKFRLLSNLNKHKLTHLDEKQFLCFMCGQQFTQKSNLDVHLRQHLDERKYKCPECGKLFRRRHTLNLHRLTHSGETPYKCLDCGKSFRYRYSFNVHSRIHLGIKPYGCSVCGNRFRTNGERKRHERRVHSDAKPYECSECGEKFRHKTQLGIHKRIHMKPVDCLECGKTFRDEIALKRHKIIIHMDLNRFQCSECEKYFQSKESLKRHKRIHVDGKPFECFECRKKFSCAGSLNYHLKNACKF